MEIFNEVLKKSGFVPNLKIFVQKEGGGVTSTGPHKVKITKAGNGAVKIKDPTTGKEELHIWIYLEENGQQFKYPVPLMNKEGGLHYLVERFAEIKEGETIIMEGKRSQSGMTNYIEIRKVEERTTQEPIIQIDEKPGEKEEEIEIPIIEDSDHEDFPSNIE